MTPLHVAVFNENIYSMSLLLTHPEIDPNTQDRDELTPLHYAAQQGYVEGIRALFTKKCVGVNITDINGRTPLHLAAMTGAPNVVRLLVNHPDCNLMIRDSCVGADHVDDTCGKGKTALQLAQEGHFSAVCRILFTHGTKKLHE